MKELTFQPLLAVRLTEKRVAACLLAFSTVTVLALAAHLIWGGDPEYTGEPGWVQQPTLWIWTLVLILIGGPALAVLISAFLPVPAGRTLNVGSTGIRFRNDGLPKRWKWADIDRIEYYAYPGKTGQFGLSFIRIVFHKGKLDRRIQDRYETPLNDIFDQIQSAHRTMAAADVLSSDPSPAGGDAAIYEGDRQKSFQGAGSWLALVVPLVYFCGTMALEALFELPRWLEIDMAFAVISVFGVVLTAGIVSYVSRPKWRLSLSPSGLSFSKSRQQANLSWSDTAEIRVHGRTGSRTMRRITIGMRSDGRKPSIGGRFRGLFDRSKLVIPDAFFASVDEIAGQLRAFQDRARQAKT